MFTGKLNTAAGLAAACLALSVSMPARALLLTYDDLVTGATPSSPAPWLTANITNLSGNTGVNIALDVDVTAPEFITSVFFSLGSSANLSQVADPTTTPDLSLDTCQGSDPASTGPYQLCFSFAPKLHVSDAEISFNLVGLHVSDFVANDAGWFSVAHLQGIQPSCSAWVGAYGGEGSVPPSSGYTCTPTSGVPEPGTLSLLSVGLVAVLGAKFRRRRVAA